VWLLTLGLMSPGSQAVAQSRQTPRDPRRIEIWGAVSGVTTGPTSTLVTSYSPPLLFDGAFTSLGGQTVTAEHTFGVGVAGGINFFPSPHVGVQVLVDRASWNVNGVNGPYGVSLQYVSRQPPNNEPQAVTVNQSSAWPDTSGSLAQLTVALNAVGRLGRPDGLNVTVSGGPTYSRFTGTVQPLGFTAFRLGGHSTLFQDDYQLAVALDAAHAFGVNAGAELNLPIAHRLALLIGFRYFGGPEIDVTASPHDIVNPNAVSSTLSLADITSRLAPIPARMSSSGSRVLVGLKVR
jgi:hypothetical protein